MASCLYSSDYEGVMPARYLRHGAQPEEEPAIADMPQLEPYWAAGFSFSRGHFKLRVPYDAYQPMVFQVCGDCGKGRVLGVY
jgi:[Skp1-protein]-hydroxyproline N-acetylglucosaminyltransferase